jgi:hypothetical protein
VAYTALNLCNAAAREIGYIDNSDSLEGEDSSTALEILQAMVDLDQGNRRLIYTVQTITRVLAANVQSYTVGAAGGDVVGARPLWVVRPMITPAGETQEIPLTPYLSVEEWLGEQLKTLTDVYPRRVLYQPTTPILGTFTFWPIQTSSPTFKYGLPLPLTTPVALTTDLAFPPGGYQELWRLQLSRRLCRPFKKPIPPELEQDIEYAFGIVARNNESPLPMAKTDAALLGSGGRGGFDIISNSYRS